MNAKLFNAIDTENFNLAMSMYFFLLAMYPGISTETRVDYTDRQYVYVPIARNYQPPEKRVVEIREYGFHVSESEKLYIRCGYDPSNDVMYIRRLTDDLRN